MTSYHYNKHHHHHHHQSNGYSDPNEFETNRIKELSTERLNIQQKTFTKWINSFLQKCNYEIEDIFKDLSDGRMLMKLLEIISGEKLGRPNAGKLRVHKIENVNKCLAFLHTKVRLESIGAEDIVDGNKRLILGLIWTIILRFQIQEIEIEEIEDEESTDKRSARDALLLWCQRRLRDYRNIHIQDFSQSWRDGMAFNALLHSQNPRAVPYDKLDPKSHLENLNRAFEVAEKQFGITRLLDAEDVDVPKPDDRSVMTYVSSYYHCFSRLNKEHKGAKRIVNIVSKIKSVDDDQEDFVLKSASLVQWIKDRTEEMKARDFPNDIDGVTKLLKKLNIYFGKEKPQKCQEKVEIEAKYFTISANANILQQGTTSFAGNAKRMQEIEQLWDILEKEENRRNIALKEELLRLERLELLASNFSRKIDLRSSYIGDMISVLSDSRYGTSLPQVSAATAALKKHKAISADIASREERLNTLEQMLQQLKKENYHGKDRAQTQFDEVKKNWQILQRKVDEQHERLKHFEIMTNLLTECDVIEESLIKLRRNIISRDEDDTLTAVEQMQKQPIFESELKLISDSIGHIEEKIKNNSSSDYPSLPALNQKVMDMKSLVKKCQARLVEKKRLLEEEMFLEKIIFDLEEIHLWVYEKIQILGVGMTSVSQGAINREKEKLRMLDNEIKTWHSKLNSLKGAMESVSSISQDLWNKLATIESDWRHLKDLLSKKHTDIDNLLELFTLTSEVFETESWLKSVNTVVNAYGSCQDRAATTSQLNRLKEMRKQIEGLAPEAESQSNKVQDFVSNHSSRTKRPSQGGVVQERVVPQVKALYAYAGNDIDMKKGEVMFLIAKNNDDWWSVRKFNGVVGFVPRNYVTEVQAKNILVKVTDEKDVTPLEKAIQRSNIQEVAASNVQVFSELRGLLDEKEVLLENYQQLFDFLEEYNGVSSWLKEQKEVLASSPIKINLAGRIEKFESNVNALVHHGRSLCKILPSEASEIKSRYRKADAQYKDLLAELKRYCDAENINEETGRLTMEYEQAMSWISSKQMELDQINSGSPSKENSLETIATKQRKLEVFEHSLDPLSDQVTNVNVRLRRAKNLETKAKSLQDLFIQLQGDVEKTRVHLNDQAMQSEFDQTCNDYLSWVKEQIRFMKNDLKPSDVTRANAAVNRIQGELEEREDTFHNIMGKYQTERVLKNRNVQPLVSARDELINALRKATDLISESNLQNQYKVEYSAIANEMQQVVKLVSEKPLGDSDEDELDIRVEKLQRRLDRFLENSKQVAVDEADFSQNSVDQLWNELDENYQERKQNLDDFKSFEDFCVSFKEMESFIDAKMKFAQDSSFKGKSGLMNKLHQVDNTESEIRVNASQIKLLNLIGAKMGKSGNKYAAKVEDMLQDLNGKWDSLLDGVEKLRQFFEASQVQLNLEQELDQLINDINQLERSFTTEDPGSLSECRVKESNSDYQQNEVTSLMRKLSDISHRLSKMEQMEPEWEKKMSDKVKNCEKKLRNLLENIEAFASICHEKLNAFLYLAELDSEIRWLEEKQSAMKVVKESNSLDSVKKISRIKNLIDEVFNRIPLAEEKLDLEKDYEESPMADEVRKKCLQLERSLDKSVQDCRELGLHLDWLKKYHDLMTELASIEHWCMEKKAFLTAKNVGSDEGTVLDSLKKHKIVELEIDCYDSIVKEAHSSATALVKNSANPETCKDLEVKASQAKSDLLAITELSKERRSLLLHLVQQFEFEREVKDLSQWISVQKSTVKKLNESVKVMDENSCENVGRRMKDLYNKLAQGENNFQVCRDILKRLREKNNFANEKNGENEKALQNLTEEWDTLQQEFRALERHAHDMNQLVRFKTEVRDFNETMDSQISFVSSPIEDNKMVINGMMRKLKDLSLAMSAYETQKDDLCAKAEDLKLDGSPVVQGILENLIKEMEQKWNMLTRLLTIGQSNIQLSHDFYAFLSGCDELLLWMSEMCAGFPELKGSASSEVIEEHRHELDVARMAIESKEERFKLIMADADALRRKLDPNRKNRIDKKLKETMDERQHLHLKWQQRKVALDQITDFKYFQRDFAQCTTFFAAFQKKLQRDVDTSSLDSIESGIKEFSVFRKNLQNQNTKVDHTCFQGSKLIEQRHPKLKEVENAIRTMKKAKEDAELKLKSRVEDLQIHHDCLSFAIRAGDRIDWMEHKIRVSNEALHASQTLSVPQQLETVRRYQHLESDVNHITNEMDTLIQEGQVLLPYHQSTNYETDNHLDRLKKKWKDLRRTTKEISIVISELRSLGGFEKDLESIEFYLSRGSYLCSAGDEGTDLEHCLDLEKALLTEMNEFQSFEKRLRALEVEVKNSTISRIHVLQERLSEARRKADEMKQGYDDYKRKLLRAMDEHKAQSEIADIRESLVEKKILLEKQAPVPERTSDIKVKQARLHGVKNFLESRSKKFHELRSNAKDIEESSDRVHEDFSSLEKEIEGIQKLCSDHMTTLEAYEQAQTLLYDIQNSNRIVQKHIRSLEGISIKGGVEEGLNVVQDAEEKLKNVNKNDLQNRLKQLIKQSNISNEELDEAITELNQNCQCLQEITEKTRKELEKEKSAYFLRRKLADLSSWVKQATATLSLKDDGAYLSETRNFITKVKLVESELGQQKQNLTSLKDHSDIIGHHEINSLENDFDVIANDILGRLEQLQFAEKCHLVLNSCERLRAVIDEKWQVSVESTISDLNDFEVKALRHNVLQASVQGIGPKVNEIKEQSDRLFDENPDRQKHVLSLQLQERLNDLSNDWEQLGQQLEVAEKRLLDATATNRLLDRSTLLAKDIGKSETLLRSDCGSDLQSVSILTKKLHKTELDAQDWESRLKSLEAEVEELGSDKNFFVVVVTEKYEKVRDKLENAKTLLKEKLEYLTRLKAFLQLHNEAGTELLWITEKETQIKIDHLDFNNLLHIESMLKRFKLIRTEIEERQPVIQDLIQRCVKQGQEDPHYADKLETTGNDLNAKTEALSQNLEKSFQKLERSLRSEHFVLDCQETLAWVKEKNAFLEHSIKVEDSLLQSCVAKVSSFAHEMNRDKNALEELRVRQDVLLQDNGVLKADRISKAFHEVDEAWTRLKAFSNRAVKELHVRLDYLHLCRERDEIVQDITNYSTIASDENYGKNLSEVSRLLDEFTENQKSQKDIENKVKHFVQACHDLKEADRYGNHLVKFSKEISLLWEEVKELAEARREALIGAKLVHGLDSSVDKITEEVVERGAVFSQLQLSQEEEALLIAKDVLSSFDMESLDNRAQKVQKDAQELREKYPDANNHIIKRQNELISLISKFRGEHSSIMETVKKELSYIGIQKRYQDWMDWVAEKIAIITSLTLADTYNDGVYLLEKHEMIMREIESQLPQLDEFKDTCETLIRSNEIPSQKSNLEMMAANIKNRRQVLIDCWTSRRDLYKQHLDYLKWSSEIAGIEAWLTEKEETLKSTDETNAKSIEEVEEMIQRHAELEELLGFENDRVDRICRLTIIESQLKMLKEKEETSRREEEQRKEKEAEEAIKRRETLRATREKKRADDRRRTQEIVFNPKSSTSSDSKEDGSNTKHNSISVNHPDARISGLLERKHVCDEGHKKASSRSWKTLFVVLSKDNLICYDKDAGSKDGPRSVISVHNCRVELAETYTKRDFVFRLHTEHGAEYMFNANNKNDQMRWIAALAEHQNRDHPSGTLSLENGADTMASTKSNSTTNTSSSVRDKKNMFDKLWNRKSKV